MTVIVRMMPPPRGYKRCTGQRARVVQWPVGRPPAQSQPSRDDVPDNRPLPLLRLPCGCVAFSTLKPGSNSQGSFQVETERVWAGRRQLPVDAVGLLDRGQRILHPADGWARSSVTGPVPPVDDPGEGEPLFIERPDMDRQPCFRLDDDLTRVGRVYPGMEPELVLVLAVRIERLGDEAAGPL